MLLGCGPFSTKKPDHFGAEVKNYGAVIYKHDVEYIYTHIIIAEPQNTTHISYIHNDMLRSKKESWP